VVPRHTFVQNTLQGLQNHSWNQPCKTELTQKHTVSNDAYQPFLRQYYRMRGGKKQWNIKKPSQSRTGPPTSPRDAGLLHRSL